MDITSYSVFDWLLFFYIYCFLGWCWESAYVSFMEKKWVDRGFMRGPYIPIYGTGAMFILVSTLPFTDNALEVYFFGMVSATLLELGTGIVMEEIFKVRYWDYTNKKLNFKGYICLESSIMWGFMSLLMVYILHEPISAFVLSVSSVLRAALAIAVSAVFCVDFAYSFKSAFDLRTMILNNERIMKELLAAQLRLESIEAVLKNEHMETAEKLSQVKGIAADHFEALNPDRLVEQLKKRMEIVKEDLEYLGDVRKEKAYAELAEVREDIRKSQEKFKEGFSSRIQSILRRNPSAYSQKYADLLDGLRSRITQKSIPRYLYDKMFLKENTDE